MDGITAQEKAQIEQRFMSRLESGLGGAQAACSAYLDWLQFNGTPGLDVDSLTRVIRWEVAHVNAVTYAFSECAADSMQAFFILHVDKGISPGRRQTPSRPSSSARLRAQGTG